MQINQQKIRNFAIVAHIDHGKSTLADRFLQTCGAVNDRTFRDQLLDSMELEREHGITIRSHPVTLDYRGYRLNLIDTPGHIDFSYEVEKSLAATDGVILLVDAAQGVQAQTVTNLHLAQNLNLLIIPVLNKIDLPNSQTDLVAEEVMELLPVSREEILQVSAKSGEGIPELINTIIRQVPPPSGNQENPLSALVFGAQYNPYLGIDLYVLLKEGRLSRGDRLRLMRSEITCEALEIGVFKPQPTPVARLEPGMVGFVTLNIKDVRQQFVGETLTGQRNPAPEPLPGYRRLKHFVYCGLYPAEGTNFPALKEALGRLQLNDPSFTYTEERSASLGPGFRAGFLGMLHMEIVQERLAREHRVEAIRTTPNTTCRILLSNGKYQEINNVANLPDWSAIRQIQEPWLKVLIITPYDYYGNVSTLCQNYRGNQDRIEFLGENLLLFTYEMPLAEIMTDFYNQLKSVTRGYASLDYEFIDWRTSDLVKLDIIINSQAVDALSTLVHRSKVKPVTQNMLDVLKKNIPRHLYKVIIQAAVGGKIVGREEVAPYLKNVTGKCYGGDITRKRKLWEKQREGKQRLKTVGSVSIPESAFLALYRKK